MLLNTQKINNYRLVCIKQFKITLDLFCFYIIECRLANTKEDDRLKLSNMHYYWHLKKLERHFKKSIKIDFVNVDAFDKLSKSIRKLLLEITNSIIVKIKDRSRDVSNKSKTTTIRNRQAKTQQVFVNSICCLSFNFEYAKTKTKTIIDFINSQI